MHPSSVDLVLAVTLCPKIQALFDCYQQSNFILSHPVVRSSVGNRVGKLALRLKPRPSCTATLPPRWTGRGVSRVKQVVKKNI
jgi:hypothetical protein